jgi:hypothetical protein
MSDFDDDICRKLRRLARMVRRSFGWKVRPRYVIAGGGKRIVLEIQNDATPAAPSMLGERPASTGLSPADRKILQAVTIFKEAPTGAELITALHYTQDESNLRKRLSSLRHRGFLGGVARDPGYPLTDAGREALKSPEN